MAFIDKKLKDKLHRIIFGTDTPAGKAFDVMLIIAIIIYSLHITKEINLGK